jgi:hypothetical protein
MFIVDRVFRSNAPGLHGWDAKVTKHETEEAARVEFDKPFTGTEYKAVLYDARQKQWKRLATRKAKS